MNFIWVGVTKVGPTNTHHLLASLLESDVLRARLPSTMDSNETLHETYIYYHIYVQFLRHSGIWMPGVDQPLA